MAKLGTGLTLAQMKALPKSEQKTLISQIKSVRKAYKAANYSCIYGVGATKLAREIGSNKADAEALIKAYWERNWSIKKVSEAAEVKVVGPNMWIKNPVSGFWHSLRSDKDRFSTLNQSTGVYCFDTWLYFCNKAGIDSVFQFHDEQGNYVTKGKEKENTLILKKAISNANDKLKLNVPLDIDIQYGSNYADVH